MFPQHDNYRAAESDCAPHRLIRWQVTALQIEPVPRRAKESSVAPNRRARHSTRPIVQNKILNLLCAPA